MDVVNQALDDRLAVPQGRLARSQGRTKATFDDRVHGFGLPTLPVYAIQPSLRHQLSTCFTDRVHHACSASPPDRRDQIPFLYTSAVKARVCCHHPFAPSSFIQSISASITSEAAQVGSVSAWSPPTSPRQD